MGLAMRVSTRWWLGGVVSLTRARRLAERWLAQGRACGQPLRAFGVGTDGWKASPGRLRRALRKISQSDRRTRASLGAGMAAGVHRRAEQTDGKATGGGEHAQGGPGNAGPGADLACGFGGEDPCSLLP